MKMGPLNLVCSGTAGKSVFDDPEPALFVSNGRAHDAMRRLRIANGSVKYTVEQVTVRGEMCGFCIVEYVTGAEARTITEGDVTRLAL